MKTAIVTGAASGIGEAFAHRLAEDGFSLWLVDLDDTLLASVAESIGEQTGQSVQTWALDLTDQVAMEPLLEEIREHDGFDLVINNAGLGTDTSGLLGMSQEEVSAIIKLHNLAPVRICHAALPAMVQKRKGAVINLSSIAAVKIRKTSHPVYTASKNFVKVFSEALYHELKPHGVFVQTLLPGWTRTNIAGWTEARKKSVPEFLWMTPREVVDISLRDLAEGRSVCFSHWGFRMYHRVRRFPLLPTVVEVGLLAGLKLSTVWYRLRRLSLGSR